ncbi:MAG TPA: dTDP-4-dehydrorhamnose 3,5-epimerase family protein [Oligoflexia bacterium]|nr:dTDP-4-dehydrorhamnose 3,5-epimerase family protein [Oligoflexia bacterium]
MIDGVVITPKKKIVDDRGAIFHMLRNDEPVFSKFGEIYFSKVHPGVVKAWHIHRSMTLNYFLVTGSVRLALFDDRESSHSRGVFQEIYLDESDSKLVTIPPLVWNGFKGLGSNSSIVANCSTEPHDPEEISRRPFDDIYFKYDWSQKNG